MSKNILIIGAGCGGLGAAYKLSQKGEHCTIIDRGESYGGLCNNFTIDGFRFDTFVHFSFSKNPLVQSLFEKSAREVFNHASNPFNIYNRKWIKHPAQNNLYPLSEEEKKLIIDDFMARPKVDENTKIDNYEQWLRLQFGNYFAEHFPMKYTHKYWMCESKNLETKWVSGRFYQPSIVEVLEGCKTPNTPITYYAKEMRYPKNGGFKAFLKDLTIGQDIRYNQNIVRIDVKNKVAYSEDGNIYHYDRLISSAPLPEMINAIGSVPDNVLEAAKKLKSTCGYLVSVGFKTKNIPPYLWWYIYDEDILPARAYSPSLKSPKNAPDGCSSLQFEIYCEKDKYTKEELIHGSVDKFVELGIIRKEDIFFIDVRFEPYANVIFDKNIYKNRNVVREYLLSIGIETIGRFGEWDYLWSDQAFLSGYNVE